HRPDSRNLLHHASRRERGGCGRAAPRCRDGGVERHGASRPAEQTWPDNGLMEGATTFQSAWPEPLERRSGRVAEKDSLELGARADAELAEHLAQVVLDGARA